MNQELDYAEMLEIPVSTVNVVKKKSFFKRRRPAKTEQEQLPEDLKERVVESVNERVGAYVYSEDVSDPPKEEKRKFSFSIKKDKASLVLFTEAVAVGVIALTIFLTNVFMPSSAINTFISTFSTSKNAPKERNYTEFTLAPVVSELSDAEVEMTETGVIYFTAQGSVYPICEGTVSKVYENEGSYTVEISHTSAFTSVITGLTTVYNETGTAAKSNIPVGYSDGKGEVRVSMYNNGTLLDCYTMTNEVPVWKS